MESITVLTSDLVEERSVIAVSGANGINTIDYLNNKENKNI